MLGCGRSSQPTDFPPPPTGAEVWAAIQPQAKRYTLEPTFIYALVAAESNFSPSARSGEARGLLQLKPAAWRLVADSPYEPNVWDWRASLETGIDYLAYLRSRLLKKGRFSYPIWTAAFHYGADYVDERGYDLANIPAPESPIFRKLWAGDLAPVPPP